MTGLHDSTLALSVYTAIARHGAMGRAQLLATLQRAWMPAVEAPEIESGLRYLAARNIVTEADGVVAARVLVSGAAATVVRNPANQTELVLSVPRRLAP
jgi:hypothetical protein